MNFEETLKIILERLDTIESKLDYLSNPRAALTVDRQAEEIRKALATGDKKVLKETMRQINGR